MRDRGTPVSREALYEEVWSDPVTVVARRYGLSDVGLVKICKKLRIPVPGRGYWAKVKAGRPTRKVPLPSLAAGTPAPSGPTPLSEQEAALRARVQDTLLKTRQSQPTISVPSELVDPHPLVRAAAARLRQRDGWDHPAGVRSTPKEVLDIRVMRNSLDRAMRLMDTLLKALEPSGFTATVDAEKGVTLLVGGGTTLSISIVEQVTRTTHTPTRKESQARDRYYDSFRAGARGDCPDIPQYDWHPTGRLTLTVGAWPSRKWNDTERSLIDARLRGIVAAIIGLAVDFPALDAPFVKMIFPAIVPVCLPAAPGPREGAKGRFPLPGTADCAPRNSRTGGPPAGQPPARGLAVIGTRAIDLRFRRPSFRFGRYGETRPSPRCAAKTRCQRPSRRKPRRRRARQVPIAPACEQPRWRNLGPGIARPHRSRFRRGRRIPSRRDGSRARSSSRDMSRATSVMDLRP